MQEPQNKKSAILQAALDLFAHGGFDGTPVSHIASNAGVSKAAVTFHFPAKTDLLAALVIPVVEELERHLAENPSPAWPDGVWKTAGDILDTLIKHRQIAQWIDADRAVHSHPEYGPRMQAIQTNLANAIIPSTGSSRIDHFRAISAIGGLWRPVRSPSLTTKDLRDHRDELLHAALVSYRWFEPPAIGRR